MLLQGPQEIAEPANQPAPKPEGKMDQRRLPRVYRGLERVCELVSCPRTKLYHGALKGGGTCLSPEEAQWLDSLWATLTCTWKELQESNACLSLLWLHRRGQVPFFFLLQEENDRTEGPCNPPPAPPDPTTWCSPPSQGSHCRSPDPLCFCGRGTPAQKGRDSMSWGDLCKQAKSIPYPSSLCLVAL